MIKLILILTVVFTLGTFANAFADMPVYEWCEWEYSDNGSVLGIYRCASPTYWDKWTNSERWQEWETTK